MGRDPTKVGRARVGAELIAEVVNGFVEPISWKTLVRLLLFSFSFFFSLFAFSLFFPRNLSVASPAPRTCCSIWLMITRRTGVHAHFAVLLDRLREQPALAVPVKAQPGPRVCVCVASAARAHIPNTSGGAISPSHAECPGKLGQVVDGSPGRGGDTHQTEKVGKRSSKGDQIGLVIRYGCRASPLAMTNSRLLLLGFRRRFYHLC